jgi:hypothetical protein
MQIAKVLDRATSEQQPNMIVLSSSLIFRRVLRPFDAKVSQVVKTNGDRAVEPVQDRVEIHL